MGSGGRQGSTIQRGRLVPILPRPFAPPMSASELHLLVLAGGESTRIRTGGPKALLDLLGRPLLHHVLRAAESVEAASRLLVLGTTHREPIEAWLRVSEHRDWRVVIQEQARGTGDAVRCALEALPARGRVLILCGDTPLLRAETLRYLAEERSGALLTALVRDPSGYGRILRDEDGGLLDIVEQADCDPEQDAINEINAGVYLLDLAELRRAVAGLRTDNAQGELYLTDAALRVLGATQGATLTLDSEEEILGVNTLVDLSAVTVQMRLRILEEHMLAGVQVDDPGSTWIECGVEIGAGTRILPGSILRAGVRVGRGCRIGPFAHLRPGTVLADGAEIGNFVETKNAELGEGAKAKHLTYLGDARIGAGANIGCGTITANYDGRKKHRTEVGERAFVGSGTILVAPVRVGGGATTGAGAVVPAHHDVAPGQTVVGVPARPIVQRSKG